jgi:hypothetical protein
MTHSLLDILIKPGDFFSGLMTEKEDLKWPLIILLAGGIVAAGYGYLIGGITAQMMSGAIPGLDVIVTLSSTIGALVGVFIFWILWTGIVFALSMVFKGEGSFRRSLQVVGYGYLPQVIGSLISLIVAVEYVPRIVVPKITSAMMEDPAAMQVAMTSFLKDPAMMELTQITSLIAIVFLLWSAHIWIFGFQHARKLSARDAALCVGIPVVLYVIYILYTLGVS